MEMGKYSVDNGVIIINAGKFQAIGSITEEKIVINNKVYFK